MSAWLHVHRVESATGRGAFNFLGASRIMQALASRPDFSDYYRPPRFPTPRDDFRLQDKLEFFPPFNGTYCGCVSYDSLTQWFPPELKPVFAQRRGDELRYRVFELDPRDAAIGETQAVFRRDYARIVYDIPASLLWSQPYYDAVLPQPMSVEGVRP